MHETIRVRSEGESFRHGILRDFPTVYRDRMGIHKCVNLRVLHAREEGSKTDQYATHKLSNGIRIRIGDPNTLLSPGEHTFELSYVATQELGFFAKHDELYWNVTGNGWQLPIDFVSADVKLPATVAVKDLKLEGYTGKAGSRAKDVEARISPDGIVQFVTAAPLQEGEGLTVVVGFPKGLVLEPSLTEKILYLLADNVGGLLAPVGLGVILIYFLVTWFLVGRDPKPGTVIVRYDPPEAISPAVLRYVQRLRFDDRILTCAVLDLAVKGYLTIQNTKSSYVLTRLRHPDDALPVEEQHLMQELFANEDSLELGGDNYEIVRKALKSLKSDMKAEPKHKFAHSNFGWFLPGAVLSAATFIRMTSLIPGDESLVIGGVALTIFTTVFLLILRSCIRAEHGERGGYVLLLFFFGLIETIFLVTVVWLASMASIFFGILVLVNVLSFRWLKVISPEGRKLLDEIKGFREFLIAVDADRFERLNPPEKSPELFEKLLPYALALGVEQQWSKQFTSVLANVSVTVGGETSDYSPNWLSGDDWQQFSASSFTESFSDGFSSAVSSASSPPGSSSGFSSSSDGFSSSDSGGSSGGGGGGGGGGGW